MQICIETRGNLRAELALPVFRPNFFLFFFFFFFTLCAGGQGVGVEFLPIIL